VDARPRAAAGTADLAAVRAGFDVEAAAAP
jgi:hypothetical protein